MEQFPHRGKRVFGVERPHRFTSPLRHGRDLKACSSTSRQFGRPGLGSCGSRLTDPTRQGESRDHRDPSRELWQSTAAIDSPQGDQSAPDELLAALLAAGTTLVNEELCEEEGPRLKWKDR